MKEEQCGPIVENAWRCCVDGRNGSLKEVVGVVASELWGNWSKDILGDLEKRTKRVKQELEVCWKGPINNANVRKEHLLRYKLEKMEEQKDHLLAATCSCSLAEKWQSEHEIFSSAGFVEKE